MSTYLGLTNISLTYSSCASNLCTKVIGCMRILAGPYNVTGKFRVSDNVKINGQIGPSFTKSKAVKVMTTLHLGFILPPGVALVSDDDVREACAGPARSSN